MADDIVVTPIAEGTYHVEHGGRGDLVYVAGPPEDRWAFWNGHVFHADVTAMTPRRHGSGRTEGLQPLTAPMPATVVKVLVAPGGTVRKGEVVVVLEAMKMELLIRAPDDATVVAVHCREGEIVQPDATLVELEQG